MGGERQGPKAGGPARCRAQRAGRRVRFKTPLISITAQKNYFEIVPADDWVDFTRKLHHILRMIYKKPRRPKESAVVARSQGEGATLQPKPEGNRETRAALAKEEEHVLRCLGAAVIMQWNDLPTRIQRDLFDDAISMGDPRHTAQLKEQIARFLHTHKNDELSIRYPPANEAWS
jgi:hypothetical protein